MRFEKWMICEIVTSDETYTIGYVNGKPAEWGGNIDNLVAGDEFRPASEDSAFGVNAQDEYRVENGIWVDLTR